MIVEFFFQTNSGNTIDQSLWRWQRKGVVEYTVLSRPGSLLNEAVAFEEVHNCCRAQDSLHRITDHGTSSIDTVRYARVV